MYGYRYQCRGFFEYRSTVDKATGPVVTDVSIYFGDFWEDESYEEPRVMACCPAYDVNTPSCAQPHTQACVVDIVEQGCRSLVYDLNAQAEAAADAFEEEAIRKAAAYVAEHQQDCFNAFAVEPGVTANSPACDANEEATVAYDQLPIGASWSFDPPGLIPNITIEVINGEHQGIFPWISDPEFPGDTCQSSDDNDHVGLLEVDPTDPVYKLKYGTAEVRSDSLLDQATLDSTRTSCAEHCSTASIKDGELRWMVALGKQSQTVNGIEIDMFRAELQGPIPAAPDGLGGFVVAAGDALFALSGSAMGSSSIVYAPNTRPIYFRKNGADWDVDPMQIAYSDPSTGKKFEFFVGATTWQ